MTDQTAYTKAFNTQLTLSDQRADIVAKQWEVLNRLATQTYKSQFAQQKDFVELAKLTEQVTKLGTLIQEATDKAHKIRKIEREILELLQEDAHLGIVSSEIEDKLQATLNRI